MCLLVAVLGTIMNNTYLAAVKPLSDIPLLQNFTVPGTNESVLNVINSSIQGAHIVASRIPIAPLANQINDTTNQAFVSGMIDAMIVASIMMVIAGVITMVILPARIRPAQPEEVAENVAAAPLTFEPAASD